MLTSNHFERNCQKKIYLLDGCFIYRYYFRPEEHGAWWITWTTRFGRTVAVIPVETRVNFNIDRGFGKIDQIRNAIRSLRRE